MLTWTVIEDRVTDLLVIAFDAGFAAGCGRSAPSVDPDLAPLLGEVQRRWEETQHVASQQAGRLIPESAELPGWLRALQEHEAGT